MELKGENRNQFQMVYLESCVADESYARVVEAFVDDLPIEQLKLDQLSKRKAKYEALNEEIQAAHKKGVTQISTTDKDARALPKKMNIIEVAYNEVVRCEAKNKLITNFETPHQHDSYALGNAALSARKAQKTLYRRRQEIVEHPFGTIKRQWGYDYNLMKGLAKVDGAFAIIFTTYNLRRAITLLGVKELIEKLRTSIYPICWLFWAHFKSRSTYFIKINIHRQPKIISLNTLKRAA